MALVTIESSRYNDLIKFISDSNIGYQFEKITVNEAAATTLKFGTALGKVTATSKYKTSLAAAADGSQTISALYIADASGTVNSTTLAANTDAQVLALVRGPAVIIENVAVLGTGHTAATLKAALLALNPPILVDNGV